MTVALDGFERRAKTFAVGAERWTRDVYVGGAGPAVVVMHEIPGLHPGVIAFARRLQAAGGRDELIASSQRTRALLAALVDAFA